MEIADRIAWLIPVAVIMAGLDYVSGTPVLDLVSSFLSQNGF